MTRFLFTLSISVFVFLAADSANSAEDPALAPKHFKATIGGFTGASYQVDLLDDGTLDYWTSPRGEGVARHVTIRPTAAEWREFRAALDAIGVWKWQSDFVNESVMDGTSWSLELAYGDRVVKSRGRNDYPDAAGKPSGKMETTPTFDRYLATVEKLLGGRTFR